MAAHLLRPSRPWLSLASSPLGPHIRSLRSTPPAGATSISAHPLIASINQRQPAARYSSAPLGKKRKPQSNSASSSSNVSLSRLPSFLLPNTLVAPPPWRYPHHPLHFWRMLKLHLKAKRDSWWALFGFKIMSQPKLLTTRPRFKANRRAAIPAAKALHQQMSEALASGDIDTLRRVCTNDYADKLCGVIDARPALRQVQWELVQYNTTWYYPNLADWQVVMQPTQQGQVAIKQAVVSIASRQRLTSSDKGKKASTTTRDMLEHVVIQANIDLKTYESGPWKIWGTVPESTLESHEQSIRAYQELASGGDK